MSKSNKETNISALISSLINTAPDYGEEDDDLTRADKLNEDVPSDSGDELNLAQFRKINIELLDADDKKYKGTRVSRRQFDTEKAFGSDSGDESDDGLDTGSFSNNDQEIDSDTEQAVSAEESFSGEEDEEDENISDDDESDQDAGTSDKKSYIISAGSIADAAKGDAIRSQLSMWDTLLECRIKFQKCLAIANKLPQPSLISSFEEAGGEKFREEQKQCKASLKSVLCSFINLENVCHDINTKKFMTEATSNDEGDEEITSSDSEGEDNKSSYKTPKRRKLTDFSHELKDRHSSFSQFRNSTIEKWNEKTRVTQMGSKDFSAFEQSALKQIEIVMADRQRLLKRTRTARSSYHILGEQDEGPPTKIAKHEENKEIFDDDDFYHQLLRELLERKSADVTDSVQLSRQWIHLQKARSKLKKVVDTKASKGRKLSYKIHQKLVNYMMPIDNTNWSDEAKTELFTSLFGQK